MTESEELLELRDLVARMKIEVAESHAMVKSHAELNKAAKALIQAALSYDKLRHSLVEASPYELGSVLLSQ